MLCTLIARTGQQKRQTKTSLSTQKLFCMLLTLGVLSAYGTLTADTVAKKATRSDQQRKDGDTEAATAPTIDIHRKDIPVVGGPKKKRKKKQTLLALGSQSDAQKSRQIDDLTDTEQVVRPLNAVAPAAPLVQTVHTKSLNTSGLTQETKKTPLALRQLSKKEAAREQELLQKFAAVQPQLTNPETLVVGMNALYNIVDDNNSMLKKSTLLQQRLEQLVRRIIDIPTLITVVTTPQTDTNYQEMQKKLIDTAQKLYRLLAAKAPTLANVSADYVATMNKTVSDLDVAEKKYEAQTPKRGVIGALQRMF